MDEEKDDEIIIGVNIPKTEKKKKVKFKKKKKMKKYIKKKGKSKDSKKSKARIFGNSVIFRNRIIRRIILLILIIIAIILFLSSSFFDIKKINVINNDVVSKDKIISLSNIGNKKNIFSINENEISNKIKENPYIDSINISKELPNTINIDVSERKVRYMIQLGDAYVYVNNQGYILEVSADKKEVPILFGIVTDISELQAGKRLLNHDLEKFDILNKIYEVTKNNEILNFISKIDLSDSSNFTLYLDSENKIVYLGDCSDLNTRILYVKAILEQEKGIEGEIFVNMDLNKDNVFFRQKI